MSHVGARVLLVVLGVAAATAAAWFVRDVLREDRRSVELVIDTGGHDPLAPPAIAADQKEMPSALAVEHPLYPRSTFRREPWNPEDFPKPTTARNNPLRFDPVAGFTFSAGMNRRRVWEEHPDGGWYVRTNSYGLRDDDEPSVERPDLRIVVVGDSHTAGYCNNAESYAQLLEARLAAERTGEKVEALNAAVPGYSFVHHLAALERMLDFQPDVAVLALYGGNDFGESLGFQHKAHGTQRGDLAALQQRVAPANEFDPEGVSQFGFSIAQFRFDPEQIDVALQAARDVLTEFQVTCLRHGIALVVVYLPAPPEIDWPRRGERYERMLSAMGLAQSDVDVLASMGDRTLEFLRSRGVVTLDMRPAFRASSEAVYWEEDFHLSIAGHAVVARELAPLVTRIAPPGSVRVRRGSPALDGAAARLLLSPGAGERPPAPPPDDDSKR